MKRIVDGVTYNTETSTAIGETTWANEMNKTECRSVLYQTRGGAFFLHDEVTRSVWSERRQEMVDREENSFTPMSQSEAHNWLIEGDKEVFHNPFEDPPEATAEAEPGATIYIRVPASLKRRVDEAAREAKLSGNVWSMRCIEKCLEKRDIQNVPWLAYIHQIAATARALPDADWSKKKCMTALAQIADYADELAEHLGVSFDDAGLNFETDDVYQENEREFQPYK